jgi:hypothetical protein
MTSGVLVSQSDIDFHIDVDPTTGEELVIVQVWARCSAVRARAVPCRRVLPLATDAARVLPPRRPARPAQQPALRPAPSRPPPNAAAPQEAVQARHHADFLARHISRFEEIVRDLEAPAPAVAAVAAVKVAA